MIEEIRKEIPTRFKTAYMNVAYEFANLSYDTRRKNGCIIIKDNRIISIGYNGTPSGWDNTCQDEHGITKPEVLHAESNAITKLARCTESGLGATLFCTTAPCLECAKLVYQSGIAEVYYDQVYRKSDGLEFLKKCKNIKIEKISK